MAAVAEAALVAAMAHLGHPMMVTDGWRTISDQWNLWLKGRPWLPGGTRERVVTFSDGLEKKSHHQSGRAADCCFVVDGKPSWDEALPWQDYGEAAEAAGLEWGGRWTTPDKPHVQLPPTDGVLVA